MPENTIPIYSTRDMQDYVAFEPGVARFMRETFFPASDLYDTNTIDVDIVSKGRPIACMVKRYEDGNLVEDSEYETRSVKTGYMNEFKVIEIDKYMKRRPGETPYNHTSPRVQAQQAEAESFKELIDRQNRAEEVMAVQALTQGTFLGRNKEGVAIYEANFRFKPEHKPVLGAGKRWDEAGVTKNVIMETVRGWIVGLLQKNGGKMPTHMILGRNAFNAFLRHVDPDDQKSGIDSFRVFRGEVTPRMQEMGVFFLGTFPELANVKVIGYNEWYDDPFDGGKTKPIFPANTALLCTTQGKYRRQYGKINHLKAPDFCERFPYIWETPDGKKRQAQLESAPILVVFEPDTVISAAVTQGD
ncbi:MAG: major capsid protein [Treponema sp.]|jgi:hypothetical protein|nr:major capsid protein [Treponema sp.]